MTSRVLLACLWQNIVRARHEVERVHACEIYLLTEKELKDGEVVDSTTRNSNLRQEKIEGLSKFIIHDMKYKL